MPSSSSSSGRSPTTKWPCPSPVGGAGQLIGDECALCDVTDARALPGAPIGSPDAVPESSMSARSQGDVVDVAGPDASSASRLAQIVIRSTSRASRAGLRA